LWLPYPTFANFSKTYDHVNTLLGPIPGHWKGAMQVRAQKLRLYQLHGKFAPACISYNEFLI